MPTQVRRALRVFRFLFEREPWVFEVTFGFFTSLFFWLLWTGWQTGPALGSIATLSLAVDEQVIQWAGIVGGGLQFSSAVLSRYGGGISDLKWVRLLSAGWLAWLWGAMASGSWLAAPWIPTAALYAACAIANLYVAFHVLWEAEYRLRRHGG